MCNNANNNLELIFPVELNVFQTEHDENEVARITVLSIKQLQMLFTNAFSYFQVCKFFAQPYFIT